MLTLAQARGKVEEKLQAMGPPADGDEFVIHDASTIERPFGWVFFYGSRMHRDTGDDRWAVAGNAPFIVNRIDGAVIATGTARPIDHYIREHEANVG